MRLKNIKEVRNFTFTNEKITRANILTGETNQRQINGYASVFNEPSKLIAEIDDDGTMQMFYEVLKPNAFDDVLRSENLDVIYCIDHDPARLIARSKANTLQLTVDNYGLKFNALLPNTSVAGDLYENIRAKNYTENSFCFTVDPEDEVWEEVDGELYRYINKVSGLYDVSSVVNPAYNGTSLSLRGKNELKKRSEIEQSVEKTEEKQEEKPVEQVKNSLDNLELEIFLAKNN